MAYIVKIKTAVKGYKDSGQGYLFYDSNKSEIKFRAVK